MSSPVIIIPSNILTTYTDIFQGIPISYTPDGFVRGLLKANATPLIVPISNEEKAKQYVDMADGVLLAGGQDVSPQLYNEEPHAKLGATFKERDTFETTIIKEAWKQKKPILAVCRGFQLMNVLFDGTLYQDLSEYPETVLQHEQKTNVQKGIHTVNLSPDSWLAGVFGEEYFANSIHHQAIKKLANDFRPVAWSKDGMIEAFESVDPEQKTIGVQWHPELMIETDAESQGLFDAFVDLVSQNKKD